MILDHLDALEGALGAAGFPPMSPWWRLTLTQFYCSSRRELVLRVGRRGGKSSTLCRVAVLEALYGSHAVPPGDIGYVAVIAQDRDSASARLRTIEAILKALGVPHRRRDDEIELTGPFAARRVGFKVFTASVAGVSGPTCIAVICDEVAKWKDKDTGANPASEVLASVRPTLATMPHGRLFLSSSPLGSEDAHAKAVALGDTDHQTIACAATWVANPTITEDATHGLEPDDRIWRREYAAIPQGSASPAFDLDSIEHGFTPRDIESQIGAPVIACDPAGRGSDAFTWATAGWCRQVHDERARYEHVERIVMVDGEPVTAVEFKIGVSGQRIPKQSFEPPAPVLVVGNFRSLNADFRSRITMPEIAAKIADDAYRANASMVVTDQFEAFSLDGLLRQHRLKTEIYTWGAQTKPKAVAQLRQMFNERAIYFTGNTHSLKRELYAYEEQITANGVKFGGRSPDGGHFDHVSCVITAIMADMAGDLHGSIKKRSSAIVRG